MTHPRITIAHDRSVAAGLNLVNVSRQPSAQSQPSPHKGPRRSLEEVPAGGGDEAAAAAAVQQAVQQAPQAAAAQADGEPVQPQQQPQAAAVADGRLAVQQQQPEQQADGQPDGQKPEAATDLPSARHVAWANGSGAGSGSGSGLPPPAPRLRRGSTDGSAGSSPSRLRRSSS